MNRKYSLVLSFVCGAAAGAVALALLRPSPQPFAADNPKQDETIHGARPGIEPSQFFWAVDPDRFSRICRRLNCERGAFSSAGWRGVGRETRDGRDYVVKDFKLDVAPRRNVNGQDRPTRGDVLRAIQSEFEDAMDLKAARLDGPVQETTDRDGLAGFRFKYAPRAAADDSWIAGEVEVTSELAADTLVIRGNVREYQK